MKFFPYIVKGLIRHRARTITTMLGAAVGLFVFCCVGAMQRGLAHLTDGDEANRRLIVFQENRFCPSTSRLPTDYARTIAGIEGVREVLPIQVYTNNCRASLDVVVFHGLPTDRLQSARPLQLIEGTWDALNARSDSAVVGRQLAMRRRLQVGRTFSVGDVTVFVAAVFRSENASEENLAYTHLDFLQRARGPGGVGFCTQLEVGLDSAADPESVAASIDETLHSGPVATTTRRKGAFQASTLSDLVDLVQFSHWLAYASVALVLSLVGTTTLMAVEDRRLEQAILQTLGFRPMHVARFVLAESLLQCMLGGAIGTVVAIVALAWGGWSVGAEGVTIAFRPTPDLAFHGALILIVTGLLAGLVPAFRAAHVDIVDALQS
jgi:putative ABC transport system permease protein